MFWGIYRRSDLGATLSAGRAETQVVNLQDRMRILEDKIDSLSLVCQAQWELIREHTGLSESDIESKVEEIDLRDGRQDGKMGRSERLCPACSRPLHKRHDRCLYCGQVVENSHVYSV